MSKTNQKTKTKKVETAALYRSFDFDQRAVDEDARTVTVTFSTEEPVERWFGREILDHKPSSVRMDRMKSGAAVLLEHRRDQHIGTVESVKISERKGTATLRFGNSSLASEVFDDVKDGIRRSVSVGYRVHKATLEEVEGDDDTYRVTDWEPFEVSIVSIPADVNATIDRSDAATNPLLLETTMPEENTPQSGDQNRSTPAAPPAATPAPSAPAVDVRAVRQEAQANERKRIADITRIGDQFGCRELVDEHCLKDTSVDAFRELVLDNIATRAPSNERPATHLDLNARDLGEYSLFRAISASLDNNWERAGFERECSVEIAKRLGEDPKGFYVPWDVQSEKRELTAGGAATGAELVGNDHLASSFIEILRANSVVASLGARMLTGLVGNVDIPKQTGAATFGWLAESGDAGLTDLATAQVPLTPRTVAGGVSLSRRLLKQSSPDAEAMVRADLAAGAGLAIDLAAMQGTGAANQPTGIVNQLGVNSVTIAAAGAPTWAEIVEFETDVESANALAGNLAFVTTAAVKGSMKVTEKAANTAQFILSGNAANGFPVRVSTQLATNRIIFGNWSSLVIGMWGVLDLMPDPATNAASGGLVIRAFQDVDIAVRHGQSFAINA